MFKGCNGCKFSRKYDNDKGYFCAMMPARKEMGDFNPVSSGSSIWPFSIKKMTDIKECSGYKIIVKKQKKK